MILTSLLSGTLICLDRWPLKQSSKRSSEREKRDTEQVKKGEPLLPCARAIVFNSSCQMRGWSRWSPHQMWDPNRTARMNLLLSLSREFVSIFVAWSRHQSPLSRMKELSPWEPNSHEWRTEQPNLNSAQPPLARACDPSLSCDCHPDQALPPLMVP